MIHAAQGRPTAVPEPSHLSSQTAPRSDVVVPFEVRVVDCWGAVYIQLLGTLDSSGVEPLSAAIEGFLSDRRERCGVALDLTELTLTDMRGLCAIAATCEVLQASGFYVSPRCVGPHVERVAEAANLCLPQD
jgi:anti-anti-sigma regulatory factor